MANIYYIEINSEKITQEVAIKILNKINSLNLIRCFDYCEGHLYYNTRGLTDISDILKEYNIQDNEINIKDEFDLLNKINDNEI